MGTVQSGDPSGACALDKALIARHRQRRPGFLERLINAYLEEAPKYAKVLRASAPAGDWDNVKMAAHTLKSSSANIGGTRLAALCLKLEQAALNQSAAEAAQHLAGFNMEYFEVEEALKALLLDLRNSATAATAAAQPNSGV